MSQALYWTLPHWSPRWEISSWTSLPALASTPEIVGALAVGLAGLAAVRARGLAAFATG